MPLGRSPSRAAVGHLPRHQLSSALRHFLLLVVAICLVQRLASCGDADPGSAGGVDPDPGVGVGLDATIATDLSARDPSIAIPDVPENMFSIPEDLSMDTADKHAFQAEIARLMSIFVHSLYSNTDVFLRELISNASDALNKLRIMLLSQGIHREYRPEIRVMVDKDNSMIHVSDTGIGMTRQELIDNLGQVAKSGTSDFIKSIQLSGDQLDNQIGQFGVGFYSAFAVADEVVVTTRVEDGPQLIWRCSSSDLTSYSIIDDPRGATIEHTGTIISLHIREDANKYLGIDVIEKLLKTYSQFILFPIYLQKEETVKIEPESPPGPVAEDAKDGAQAEGSEEDDSGDKKEDIKKDEPKYNIVKKWVLINPKKPLWTMKPSEVTKQEHAEFYAQLNPSDKSEPFDIVHFNMEGDHAYTALFYIPKESHFNLFDMSVKYRSMHLYVRRVFITNEFNEWMPRFMSFLIGLVDSNDLPLNVSREVLQKRAIFSIIAKQVTSKTLKLLENMLANERDRYAKFYNAHRSFLQYGVVDSSENRERLVKLLMFRTRKHDKDNRLITLQEYVNEMPANQTCIFVLGGDSMRSIRNSPLLEPAAAMNYDVVYLPTPLDAYTMDILREFKDDKSKSIPFEDLSKETAHSVLQGLTPDETKKIEEEFKLLIDHVKTAVPEHVGNVVINKALGKVPCALVGSHHGVTANMERLMRSQYGQSRSVTILRSLGRAFQINPEHIIIKELLKLSKDDSKAAKVKRSLRLLYDSALVASGYMIERPTSFSRRIFRSVIENLDLDTPEEELLPVQDLSSEEGELTSEDEDPYVPYSDPINQRDNNYYDDLQADVGQDDSGDDLQADVGQDNSGEQGYSEGDDEAFAFEDVESEAKVDGQEANMDGDPSMQWDEL